MTKQKETNKFKDSLNKLEEITEWFQNEDIDLDVGIKKLREGVALIKECRTKIKEIENEFVEIKKELQEEVEDTSSFVTYN